MQNVYEWRMINMQPTTVSSFVDDVVVSEQPTVEQKHCGDVQEHQLTKDGDRNHSCFPYLNVALSTIYNKNPSVFKSVAFVDEVEIAPSVDMQELYEDEPQKSDDPDISCEFEQQHEKKNNNINDNSEDTTTSRDPPTSDCCCELCSCQSNDVIVVPCTVEDCPECRRLEEEEAAVSNEKITPLQKCEYWVENGNYHGKSSSFHNKYSGKKNTHRRKYFNEGTKVERAWKTLVRCFRCLLNRHHVAGSSSGGSGSGGGDDEDEDGDGDNYMEHGDEVSGGDDSDGGDSGSETGDDGSLNSAELFDDQQNQLDMKDTFGEFDNSDGGGSAASEVSDSLTELEEEEEAEEANSNSSDDSIDDDDDDDDDENSWQSIIIYERE